jgi:cell division septation protein DedD
MPSREPELYKDKIEVSLDGRQIFYLFFGGAVIVGLVFVVGVMVGRRVESRGHLDRADTQTASDPLAALDRLDRSDRLSFHGSLTGGEPASDVEKAIGELEKRRAAGKADPGAASGGDKQSKPEAKVDGKLEVKADAKLDSKVDSKPDARAEKLDAKPDKADRAEVRAEPITRPDPDKPKSDKHDGDRKSKKHDDGESRDGKSDKPVTRPDTHADRAEGHSDGKLEARADAKAESRTEARTEPRSDPKSDAGGKSDAKQASDARGRFTLQLSSFQDKSEAEAFLSATKSAGFQAYITEAEVGSKGTFYRVRFGAYRSIDAANDAKAEYEKTAKKTAQVMRL